MHLLLLGELTSPNYPQPWESGGDCSWTITGETLTDRVTLTLTHIDLPDRSNCNETYIQLFDGPDANSSLIGKYCSREIPHSVTSQGNSLTVFLHVPHLSTASGFRAIYTVEESACGGHLGNFCAMFGTF